MGNMTNNIKSAGKRQPFFYGIIILIAGTIGVWASIPGQTMGVSTFTDPVKDALGLSRNQFSWAYTLGTIMSSFLLGYAGKWFDKYGARRLAMASAFGLSGALLLSSRSEDITNWITNGESIWLVSFIVIMFCFFLLRFAGQGVLTMASRNMIMLWFDEYRGRMNAISSVAVSLGFSISPLWINALIENGGWQHAWQMMSYGLMVVAVLIYLLYRDKPEVMGLKPDGNWQMKKKKEPKEKVAAFREYTRGEAIRTRAFWMFALMMAFNGYFITGLTFHIVSVFESVGLSNDRALSIFLPMSFISVSTSMVFNTLSDMMRLKHILFIMIAGGILASLGLSLLHLNIGYYMLIVGAGILGGLFAVLAAVTWPRFYGRKHLGAISGVSMQMIVFSSALGPLMFSYSYKLFGTYSVIALAGLVGLAFIAIGSLKADNPQLKQEE